MDRIEKYLGIIIVISILLKFNLTPFSGILLMLSLTALAIFYFYFGKAIFNGVELKKSFKKESYKEIPNLIVVISNITGFGLSLVCIGIMFKLNYWTYSYMQIIVGLGIISLISLVAIVGWMKSKNDTYKRILKRTIIFIGFGLIIAFTPESIFAKIQFENNPNFIKENPYLTEQINNSIFHFKLDNGKLTDTLKVSDSDNNLFLFQDWTNGKLKKTSIVDEYGKIRELEFYEKKDSNSTTQYYIDINDRNFKTFPFNNDIFDFYEKHCFLSKTSIYQDKINEVDVLNYPMKHLMFAVTSGSIKLGNDNFLIEPDSENGDTMKVLLHHPLKGNFNRKFDLIIK